MPLIRRGESKLGQTNDGVYSLALEARSRWALHRVSAVANDAQAAEWHLGWALKYAGRSGYGGARADDTMACPHLLADVFQLAEAWSQAFETIARDRRNRRARDAELSLKLRTLEGIREWFDTMAKQANHGSGQVYELFSERFSGMVDENIERVEPAYRGIAMDIARKEFDYQPPDVWEVAHEEREASGECSLTGIDPWCCPCGRHE